LFSRVFLRILLRFNPYITLIIPGLWRACPPSQLAEVAYGGFDVRAHQASPSENSYFFMPISWAMIAVQGCGYLAAQEDWSSQSMPWRLALGCW
jgi:hypothetical protein